MNAPGAGPSKYRADVDGMRALAVLLVIANHFNPALAPGGFVGVDIFFVISGFVVTGSIVQSATGNAGRDVVHFWTRRFFRIFPVLLLFVSVTLLVISVFTPPYPPVPYNGNVRAGLASLVGLSNIYIYRIGLDYFQDGALNAFIHTWSLGVEEQFYVAYSILFIVFPRLFSSTSATKIRVATLLGLGLLSLGLFLHGFRANPMQTYYFLPPRFWELAAGGLIALAPQNALRGARFPKVVAVLQLAAASLLVVVAFAPAEFGGSPLTRIPFAVAAAAILIATGARAGAPLAPILSWRPVVFVGLISYSLYLWHWPVLVIFRSTLGLESLATLAAALLAMTGLAIGSWWFVERPWRRARRPLLILPYAAVLGTVVVGLALIAQQSPGRFYAGHSQDWAGDWMPAPSFAWLGAGRVTARECMLANGAEPPSRVPTACSSRRSAGAAPTVLIIGDSLAAADWPMAAVGERRGALRLSTLAHSGCSIDEAPATQAPSCAKYWMQAPLLVRRSVGRGDVVVIATLWSGAAGSGFDAAPARIATIAEAARSVGAATAVQAPLPHFARSAYTCTVEWFRLDYSGCSVSRSSLEPQRRRVLQVLEGIRQTEASLQIWDPFPRLCPAETCSQFAHGRPIFRDYTHLAAYGATELGPAFVEFIQATRRTAQAPGMTVVVSRGTNGS